MTLSESNKKLLQEKGILFLEKMNSSCFILKEKNAVGNTFPGLTSLPIVGMNELGETGQEIASDAPMMMLEKRESTFVLSCWNWVPGPGPGDFEETFDDEQDVVDFIHSYYFGYNKYFEARKAYQETQLDK